MVWLGRRGLCLSLPHPFMLEKTLEHLLAERGGEKNPTKNCSIYADIGKKNKWQIIFQKKPKKTRLFLANKLPSLWEAASSAQPQPAGKTKGSLGGAAAGNAGRRPGEGRENAGSAARHSAAAPGAARAQLTFQSSWFSIECPSPPHPPFFNASMYSKQSYDQNPTQGCKRGVELHFGTDGAHPFCRRLLAKRHLRVEGIQEIRDFAYYGALFVPSREVRGSVKGLSAKKSGVGFTCD